jgi:hypothetical protein
MNPNVEIIPAPSPQSIDAAGLIKRLEGAPITTPPAKDAFKISSISNFYLHKDEIINAPKQLPVKAKIVF